MISWDVGNEFVQRAVPRPFQHLFGLSSNWIRTSLENAYSESYFYFQNVNAWAGENHGHEVERYHSNVENSAALDYIKVKKVSLILKTIFNRIKRINLIRSFNRRLTINLLYKSIKIATMNPNAITRVITLTPKPEKLEEVSYPFHQIQALLFAAPNYLRYLF